jgi:hypothetical protein
MTVQTVKVVKIYPTEIWYEKDLMGTVHIKMQHEGMHEHTMVLLQYNYAYTSNAHQHELTKKIGKLLGEEDIQQRPWTMPESWKAKNDNSTEDQCGCYNCMSERKDSRGWPLTMSMLVVCPECGNKRCPRATDHNLACTGSNEPGQPGSRY